MCASNYIRRNKRTRHCEPRSGVAIRPLYPICIVEMAQLCCAYDEGDCDSLRAACGYGYAAQRAAYGEGDSFAFLPLGQK